MNKEQEEEEDDDDDDDTQEAQEMKSNQTPRKRTPCRKRRIRRSGSPATAVLLTPAHAPLLSHGIATPSNPRMGRRQRARPPARPPNALPTHTHNAPAPWCPRAAAPRAPCRSPAPRAARRPRPPCRRAPPPPRPALLARKKKKKKKKKEEVGGLVIRSSAALFGWRASSERSTRPVGQRRDRPWRAWRVR